VHRLAWQRSSPDDIETLGLTMMNGDSDNNRYRHILLPLFIWYWCIVWWFIQDNLKIFACQCVAWYRALVKRREHRTAAGAGREPIAAAAATPATPATVASVRVSGDAGSVPVPVALNPIRASSPASNVTGAPSAVALVSVTVSSVE
jgi:hypothetical protein